MVGDILQPTHLLLILVVALLVLGPKRLPEVGRALGNGLRDFRSAMEGVTEHREELSSAIRTSTTPDPPTADASAAEPSVAEPAADAAHGPAAPEQPIANGHPAPPPALAPAPESQLAPAPESQLAPAPEPQLAPAHAHGPASTADGPDERRSEPLG
jgi:TatA/E family protein of Tat protein translocase